MKVRCNILIEFMLIILQNKIFKQYSNYEDSINKMKLIKINIEIIKSISYSKVKERKLKLKIL